MIGAGVGLYRSSMVNLVNVIFKFHIVSCFIIVVKSNRVRLVVAKSAP